MKTIQKRTACNRDCPDACGLIATISDGRVTRLQGDSDHPITQGFICRRTSRFLERQYSPDRLLTPLLRDGEAFIPITWDRALDMIAEKMLQYRSESGGASIFNYRCGGSMGISKVVIDHFFEKFGPVTTKSGDICSGAGEAAQEIDFGICESHDFFDLQQSKTIVLWGKNVFVSSVHLIPQLREARKNGAKIVLIDPVHHRTASICDLYVQPKPGTDFAIALGIARWMLENELWDPAAEEYCDYFEEYRSLVMSQTVSQYAQTAEISTADLIDLARVYATGPASIQAGWGMQRRKYGATTIRFIDALAAVSGNIGVTGGGVSFCFARRGAFDFSFTNPDSAPRKIPEPLFGEGIINASDPPIRMVMVSSANPVAMLPDSQKIATALKSREFTVVIDSFMTDTARCAHLVLPATTMLEEDDLLGAYGHHYLTQMKRVIEPPPEIKTDLEIVQQLASRVGLHEQFSDSASDWQQRLLAKLDSAGINLESFDETPTIRNPLVNKVMFADRKFPTDSGRIQLIYELPNGLMEKAGSMNKKPTNLKERKDGKAQDVCHSQAPAPNRLILAALSTDQAQGSQWTAVAQQGIASAVVHPQGVNGFSDGEEVILRSTVGEMRVQLKFDQQQRSDMIIMEKGGWLDSGRCANVLICGEVTDHGQCAVYYDTVVEVISILGGPISHQQNTRQD